MPSSSRTTGARTFLRLGGLVASLLLTGMVSAADLSIGFMPGPYRDAFTKGIEPLLKKRGYTIKYLERVYDLFRAAKRS